MPRELLHLLADGKFHSGTELANQLGVSRTAIWKKVGKLESDFSVKLHSVRGKGYRLPSALLLLEHDRIWRSLDADVQMLLEQIDLRLAVDSTNEVVKQKRTTSPYACLAELQTAGRGRRGRQWVSPFGKNLYLSLRWQFTEGAAVHHGLSLCVGIALARIISRAGLNRVQIKWPNDLVCDGRKIAGVLLEAVGEMAGDVTVIVGVGINVDMDREEGSDIDQDWSTLNHELGRSVDRNWLAAEVLNELVVVMQQFQRQGFQYFREEWQRYDALNGCRIELRSINRVVEGVAKGVTATGALIVENDQGQSVHDSGEVSARVKA